MFVDAIKQAIAFTRPIHSIYRFHGAGEIFPCASTLFFVNADGWALTAKHVAQEILNAGVIRSRYTTFKKELKSTTGRKEQKKLERGYDYVEKSTGNALCPVDCRHRFINCVDGQLQVEAKLHSQLDIALLKFYGFTRLRCLEFPRFAVTCDDLQPGKSLCRLGFPFAEFRNYAYDSMTDEIAWTDVGRQDTPYFPLEGMVTRLLQVGTVVSGFELSTPGLLGQSGGPVFDSQARVWGMQTGTAHLDLAFDVDMQVARLGRKHHIKESALLHVGRCIHVSALKEFMRANEVAFGEDEAGPERASEDVSDQ